MDIALKTLVLIIYILVPGFIFRRVYFQGTFSKQFDSKSWSHSLFYSALFGIMLNFGCYHIYETFVNKINYHICLELYNSISKDTIDEIKLKDFNIINVYKYLSILYSTSIILGWLIYIFIRNLKLDRYFEPLRFLNHWHYYFTGEIKDFKEFTIHNGRCSVVVVDVLVKSERDGSNLYSGLLSSYSLDGNGNLESIALTQAQIFKTINGEKKFKDIHSHVFIIPNSLIQNLNLRYTFEEDDDTVINFITVIIYISSILFIWIDPDNHFTDYNLISKIVLKLIASIGLLSIPIVLESIYKYFLFNSKAEIIPDGINSESRARIEASNEEKRKKKKELKNDIMLGPIIGLVFLGLLSIIFLLTN